MQPTIECEDCEGKGIDPGSLREPEPCLTCGGTGRELIEAGDRIIYRNDEAPHEGITTTVLEVVTEDGWLEVRDEPWAHSIEGDTPWIAPSLIVAKLAPSAEPKPITIQTLTLEERLVASIAVAHYRREQDVA